MKQWHGYGAAIKYFFGQSKHQMFNSQAFLSRN
jgi:hypothetical protein